MELEERVALKAFLEAERCVIVQLIEGIEKSCVQVLQNFPHSKHKVVLIGLPTPFRLGDAANIVQKLVRRVHSQDSLICKALPAAEAILFPCGDSRIPRCTSLANDTSDIYQWVKKQRAKQPVNPGRHKYPSMGPQLLRDLDRLPKDEKIVRNAELLVFLGEVNKLSPGIMEAVACVSLEIQRKENLRVAIIATSIPSVQSLACHWTPSPAAQGLTILAAPTFTLDHVWSLYMKELRTRWSALREAEMLTREFSACLDAVARQGSYAAKDMQQPVLLPGGVHTLLRQMAFTAIRQCTREGQNDVAALKRADSSQAARSRSLWSWDATILAPVNHMMVNTCILQRYIKQRDKTASVSKATSNRLNNLVHVFTYLLQKPGHLPTACSCCECILRGLLLTISDMAFSGLMSAKATRQISLTDKTPLVACLSIASSVKVLL